MISQGDELELSCFVMHQRRMSQGILEPLQLMRRTGLKNVKIARPVIHRVQSFLRALDNRRNSVHGRCIPGNQPTMSMLKHASRKFSITRTGLELHEGLSFEEWREAAPLFGQALRSIAFVIGDWLLYGQANFQNGLSAHRITPEAYNAATAATGLDRTTLQNYAYVARRVPKDRRSEHLSWEHHKVVAKLKAADQKRWLALAVPGNKKKPMSTMLLRKSIQAGRLLTVKEALPDPADRGVENHIPYVNRLVALWSGMKDRRWLQKANRHQVGALMRDLLPVVEIYRELHEAQTRMAKGRE
jgi:hypothetical protein